MGRDLGVVENQMIIFGPADRRAGPADREALAPSVGVKNFDPGADRLGFSGRFSPPQDEGDDKSDTAEQEGQQYKQGQGNCGGTFTVPAAAPTSASWAGI